jgi:hypothetical protein
MTISTAVKPAAKRVRLNTTVVPEQETQFGQQVDELIVGQPRAKAAIRRAYRRYLDPLRDLKKPIYSIIAIGPSRTGKTLTAEALAQVLHDNPDCLVRINGGDYMEKEYLAALTGARSTLVGYVKPDEMGASDVNTKDPYAEFSPHNLFKYGRRGSKTPVTVVLIDEWEKACAEFNNVMLAILDNGKLTLGNGVEVNFRNVIFVFTSNLGMEELEKRDIGFTQVAKAAKDIGSIVERHMKDRTRPEFRNRIKENGEIVVFDNLTDDEMYEVVNRELNKVRRRMLATPETMIRLEVEEPAKRFLLDMAMKGEDGNISKLKDVIAAQLLDKLGGEMIKHTVEQGDVVEVVLEGDTLAFYNTRGGALIGSVTEEVVEEPVVEKPVDPSHPAGLVVGLRTEGGIFLPGPTTTVGGIMMSELMFLQRAQSLKLAAKLYPQLMARYNVSLSHATSLEELSLYGTQLATELTQYLGAELLKSETTFQPEYSVRIQVSALPGQIDIIQLRFPGVVVELDESEKTEQKK